jgi:NAD(P)-dependent dehydrogenase (short-subunit alcohol dehydrogenase family)
MGACEGRVAVVTGAAGDGMGRAIALTLAREGAKVIVNYRSNKAGAEAIVSHIAGHEGEAVAVQADVFTAGGCATLVDAAVKQFGRVDILVINPGAGWHPEPPDKATPTEALRDVENEVAPIFYLLPLVLPSMYERRWGRIIALGLEPGFGSPAYSYNVGKAARAYAMLLAKDAAFANGVTMNVLSPGPVDHVESLDEAIDYSDRGPAWLTRKAVTPQDIAEGVAFLCSEAGRFITGAQVPYE